MSKKYNIAVMAETALARKLSERSKSSSGRRKEVFVNVDLVDYDLAASD